ncbi:Tripartite tricarboxylate transporter substrate binding protein [Bordetella tumbae]|uniref:Bug family tripartite tricarboxylate transporter substrate binding protein n=1 Tax=Bordetella tumbae TaxID=1649139 RepID=UPI0039F07B40
MTMHRVACIVAGGAALALSTCNALAQYDYPNQPIRLIVPYSAGGGTDTVARKWGERISQRLGQNVIVENRPGANGIIGTRVVATAKPDGYTLVLVVNSHLINPLVQKDMPYDTFKDFVGVTMVARSPLAFLVSSTLPFKTMNEFMDASRKPNARYSYGSSENMTRLVGNMLDYYGKLNIVSVSYKGGAPLMTDVAGGIATIGTTSILTSKAFVDGGRARPLAITGSKRTPVWPDVPTMKELGMPEFNEVYTSYSLFAPAGTPKPILEKLQHETKAVVFDSSMRSVLAEQAAEPVADTVDEFNAANERAFKFWKSLADAIDLKPI